MESKLVLKLNLNDINLAKKLKKYLDQNRHKFPRFIFQEAMKGFIKYPEITKKISTPKNPPEKLILKTVKFA